MKYLVTGGHGKLGDELCPIIDCIAPAHGEMDILSPEQIEKFASREDIQGIVHLAAVSSRAAAEKDKALSYRLNVLGTRAVAQAAQRHGKKMIYISTDFVFDGKTGNYRESDTPNPPDWYGFTKYAGELEVQNAVKEHLIIRTSFRPSVWGFPTAYTNVFTTADYTDVIAKEIALCMKLNPSGTYHIGTGMKSFYELAALRNTDISPEESLDPSFPKRRDLSVEKWLASKNEIYGK